MVDKTFIEKLGAYENDEMDQDEIIKFFQEMVDDGIAWKLQGHYGRVADVLIESGLVKEAEQPFIETTVEVGEVNLFCNTAKKDLTSETE